MAADAQRDPIASVSTQSSPIASVKNHSRKLKHSAAHNGTTPSSYSSTVPDVSSPPPFQALRPFRRYSRRTLVALAKSPLVAPPPGMPALKDWFGEWEPHVSPRKENDHHTSSNANAPARNRQGRREGVDDDTRSSYKSQFSQISQTMGNFRHHSSRLDERAERDSHERLRNLSESYDRNKLLASSASARRDPLPKNGTAFASRRGDDRDKDSRDKDVKDRSELSPWDRRDNGRSERSSDWRRSNPTNQESEDAPSSDRRGVPKSDRTLDPHREGESHKGRPSRLRGRSPSPAANYAGADRVQTWERRRSQSRSRVREDNQDRERRTQGRRGKELDTSDDRERRAVNGNSRRSGRDGDREREKDGRLDARGHKDANREKEPAWMGDYVPETSDEIFGRRRSKDSELDDLQAWKRQLKEQEAAASDDKIVAVQHQGVNHLQACSDDLDDIQRFQLKLEEQSADNALALGTAGDGSNGLLPPIALTQPPCDSSFDSAPMRETRSTADGAKPVADSPTLASSNRRLILETQSPLSVAGIDAEYSFQRFATMSQSPVGQDIPATLSKPSSNGRLTPTPATSVGSNVSPYAVERADSPGSSASPAPQNSGKGSRFAKFWDNRTKDRAAPPPASSPVSSVNTGPFNSPWSAGPPDLRPSRAQSQPVSSMGGPKTLDSLLQHLSVSDSHSITNRAMPPPIPNNPDADSMHTLLSMLDASQGSHSSRAPNKFNNNPGPPAQEFSQNVPLANYPPYSSLSSALPPLNPPEPDRTFVPDGMVPGLRLPQRAREASVPQLPALNSVGPSASVASYGEENHEPYQRLQHQASWEQLQTRSSLGSAYPSGAQNQHLGPPRMSAIPPSSLSNGLNGLRQSPNHLHQQQSIRNPRANYELGAFGGPQFAGMNPGATQYGGPSGNILGGVTANAAVLLSHRVPDAMLNQGFGGNVPQSNSFGLYDVSPQPARESHNPLLMSGASVNGPTPRNMDGIRSNVQTLPIYQSHSPQQQHLLQQQHQSQRGNPSTQYAMQTQLGQHPGQSPLAPMQSSMRPGNLGGPNDYIPAANQPYSTRSYGNLSLHPSQQGQPDLMALLIGGPPSFRAE